MTRIMFVICLMIASSLLPTSMQAAEINYSGYKANKYYRELDAEGIIEDRYGYGGWVQVQTNDGHFLPLLNGVPVEWSIGDRIYIRFHGITLEGDDCVAWRQYSYELFNLDRDSETYWMSTSVFLYDRCRGE